MSEFNKEQLVIFINNLFIVIGGLFTYHTIATAYGFYLVENYSSMSINLVFGLSVGVITFWLFFTALKKGMDEFIQAGFPHGFMEGIANQLQIRIDDTNKKISDKKKELDETEDEDEDEDETNA